MNYHGLEIKDCPFCGNTDLLPLVGAIHEDVPTMRIYCKVCLAQGPVLEGKKALDGAVKQWNVPCREDHYETPCKAAGK
jgi:hypothetical protein